MEHAPSPRSSRTKKKSHLAKLAARKKESDDSASDLGSRTSLNDQGRQSFRNQSEYPVEANVQVNNRNRHLNSDDSDEGIGLGGSSVQSSSAASHAQRLPSEGTLNRFQSMRVNGTAGMDESDDDDEDETESDETYQGGKREREQNSDGDDLRKESGSSRIKKKSFSNDSDEELTAGTSKDSRRSNVGVMKSDESESGSESEDVEMNRTYKRDTEQDEMKEQYRRLLSAPDASDSPKVTRRRSPLSMRKSELDPVEENDAFEESPPPRNADFSRKFSPPRPSAMSPTPPASAGAGTWQRPGTSGSGSSYPPRPWSASMASGTEAMSERSMNSTSAMPLISTKEMRNRSFLVGSMTSNGSMLGQEELERFFPDRKMRVYVGTWNMCEMKKVPPSLDDFMLPDNCDFVCDMYVIGTQESTANRKEWEIKLQETLGPHHVLYHSAAHGVLYTSVFIRRDLIWFCSIPETSTVSTRAFSAVKTKGGLGMSITVFGTSFLFVNCHLSPHDNKMKERIADYNKINSGLNLPREVNANTYAGETGLAFQDFQEGRIKFLPSYKYDIGTNNIDTSKKLRVPSYTDRILFRCKRKHAVTCIHYDLAYEVKESDHKPVYGVYEVTLRPGRDNIPLSAGQFNREVWLEANTRRAKSRDSTAKSKGAKSAVCSIQ